MSYFAIVNKLKILKSIVGHLVKKWKDGKSVYDISRLGASRKYKYKI